MNAGRPPWRTVILGWLGFTGLPTKVNCWFCNQNSYLLPGTKENERSWYCHICENNNFRDENGDIVDQIPNMRDEKLNRPVTPKRSATRAAMHARRLCDSCEANQQLIYQIMSDYIRDEKDPEYQHSIETADAYKAKLHEKHPLCDACQAKIDALVAEQKAVLQQRQRDATMSSAEQIPRLPSLPVCLCRTTLWSLCHLGTFLLCLYVHYYPPQYRESDATNPVWSNFLSEVVIWYQAQPGLLPALDALVRRRLLWFVQLAGMTLWQFFIWFSHASACVVRQTPDCYSTAGDHMGILIAFQIVSMSWLYWHPRVSGRVFKSNTVRGWQFYKYGQLVLFISRCVLLVILAYCSPATVEHFSPWIATLVPMVLIPSLLFVYPGKHQEKAEGHRKLPTRNEDRGVDRAQLLKKSMSDLYEYSEAKVDEGKETDIDEDADQTVRTATASIMERLARIKPARRVEAPLSEENDVDNIASRLYKIAFNS